MNNIINRIVKPFLLLFTPLMFMQCDSTDIFFAASSPEYTYEGRILPQHDVVRMEYPGTKVRVCFTGSKVWARLKCNAGYYVAEIDSMPAVKISTVDSSANNETALYCLAGSLPGGKHQLSLTLVSEGLFDHPAFYGLQLEPGDSISRAPEKPHRIDFIGNSITCAYGVEARNQFETFSDSTSNFSLGYAGLVAKAFDASSMVVARSGIGMYRNYNGPADGDEWPMPRVYEQTFVSESPLWHFKDGQPDVLCVNLGTNDFSVGEYDAQMYEKAAFDFIFHLRQRNPQSKIVLLTGCMLQPPRLNVQKNALNNVEEKLKSNGVSLIYRLDMEPQDGTLGYGADWHPSRRQQQKMARELTSFIEEITGWQADKKVLE